MTDDCSSKVKLISELSSVIEASCTTESTRVCLLSTRDREYAINVLKETAEQCGIPLHHFTLAGRYRHNAREHRWEEEGGESTDGAALLRHALDLRGRAAIIVEESIRFLSDECGDPRVRMVLAQRMSAESRSEGSVIIFVEPPESRRHLPSIVADQFVKLEVEYPRASELEEIAREEIAFVAQRTGKIINVETIRSEAIRLASGLVGLPLSAARDALRDALAQGRCDLKAANELLQQRKAEILRRELSMEVHVGKVVENPIGLDYLMEYVRINQERMRRRGPDRARGILLAGPPGTGKSMAAMFMGQAVGFPVVGTSIADLMTRELGGSERRFRHLFATAEAQAPVLLRIDEIEKAFSDSSELDGGTMKRCTGAFLSWLQDCQEPVCVVATCNNPKRMGELGLTLTRPERFDALFFVDVPSFHSRLQLLTTWLRGVIADHETVAAELAQITPRFSGADLRSVVKHATALAEYQKTELTFQMLKSQVERKRMRAIAMYDEFQELRRWGRTYCEPAGPTGD